MRRKPLTPMLESHELGIMIQHGWLPRGLSHRQAKLLALLRVRPSMTRADYEALTGISPNTAQADLAELIEAGHIERVGAGPACRYTLPASWGETLAAIALKAQRDRDENASK